MSPEGTRDYIKHNNMKFDKLKKGLPNPNKENKENTSITKAREIDKYFNFDKTKFREIVSFDYYTDTRCIYYHKYTDAKGGPITAKMKQLDPWADGRCICGNEVPIERFSMMQCGNYVESRYYNSMGSSANRWREGLVK